MIVTMVIAVPTGIKIFVDGDPVNVLLSLKLGRKAGPNPWGARTLEWMIDSPAPYYNYGTIPAVLAAPYDFGNPLPYIGLEAAEGAAEATPTQTAR
jgi:heme/copper-type cytochrome/quinol oxidase subunit 1